MKEADGEGGFVLVATLWFVALLALVAVIIAGWMSRTLDRAHLLQRRAEAQIAEIDAVNRIAYLMTSNYFSVRGLEVLSGSALAAAGEMIMGGVEPLAGTPHIALDGRPYRLGNLVLRLQDEHGLYSLNFPTRETLAQLLRTYGIPYDERDGLTDKLLDYLDKNEFFSRLNGATREEYQRGGRPPPRLGPLLTPWELHRVLGWGDYGALWRGDAPLPAITTTSDLVGINPNTASAAVLATAGFADDAIARLLQHRQKYLIENDQDLELASGQAMPFLPGQFIFFPAPGLRLTLAAADGPEVRVIALRLTPTGQEPLRIDYSVALPRSGTERDLLARKDLPDLPAAAAGP
ncbi:MAG TPA: hypothetical protein VFA12_03480 [Stellaceae bacterium]|nr:hypothetical protein [Stellaceae bacterium]